MLKRVVTLVEALAVVAVVVFVVMLFANEPDEPAVAESPGAEVYAENCAACHGADGGGVSGPQLSDGLVIEKYPDVEEQIAIVEEGPGTMPAFEGRLSPEEIAQVVDYTRNDL